MKLAIHHRAGSFSDRWIAYCDKQGIDYKLVNAFDSDIIQQVADCDAFMWHHHHAQYKDVITAKRILFALEHAGVKVFPDFKTGWHFDDKVAQKYLLEAINAPLVPSYVFYDKQEALSWASETTFPKVFKLKGGAGAANVKLVKTQQDAIKLIKQAFGRGFPQFDRWNGFKERIRKYKEGKAGLLDILKGLGRLLITTEFAKQQAPEKGYVYFQDFVANNDSDTRVIVIGDRAFGVKRLVRENDFRASGSGNVIFESAEVDQRCIELSFKLKDIIAAQSIGFDFVFNENNEPQIVEFCYGFSVEVYDLCPGYWDAELNWHEGKFNPQEWMVDDVINKNIK